MQAMDHGRGNTARLENQARNARGQLSAFADCGLDGVVLLAPAHLRHALSDP
jgi:hypothetical protein